jgi:2-polyprenyl-6-methoxyphenol hydroxylase-like FAD-dependent oxidoreductase
MKKNVLISGASIAGLTIAYWLSKHSHNVKVTIVEISSGLRRGGSPIDVRGTALDVVKEMGILEKLKAKKLDHFNEVVNAQNETIVSWNNNEEYVIERPEDIEIHRDDLVDILYESIPTSEVEFLFKNGIEKLIQQEDKIEVTFKDGKSRNFDLVFGADGTHSAVRKLAFGNEEDYSKFFGAYFAIAEAKNIKTKPNTGIIYNEPSKLAALYPFKNAMNALLAFRSPKLNWDYKNQEQHKQILKDNFRNSSWRIPEILDAMLHSDNLYFDEVCQIKMPSWTKGRVALVGDAAHTTSFPTGMGTSLAIQGATILVKELLASNDDYNAAFAKYNETYRPYVESIQARIVLELKFLLPETEEGIQEAIKRFKK